MRQRIDLSGCAFERLRVVSKNPNKYRYEQTWNCACSCGGTVVVRGSYLKSGHTRSCGCLIRDAIRKTASTHGGTKTDEYTTWRKMKERCLNPNYPEYFNYGGRGITICDRWLGVNGFPNFFADMGKKKDASHTLDRIDTNGNYEPGNCRWADWHTQQNNRRSNHRVTHQGEEKTVAEWERHLGLRSGTIRGRMFRGWSFERAIRK